MSRATLSRAARARFLAVALCVSGAGAGCLAPKPTPDQWLEFGYGSPEATVRSFLTALAGGIEELEYVCLSRGLKERTDGNLLGYLVFRDELKRQMPWLKAAARAEVVNVDMVAPGRARVTARVDWMFWDESFVIDVVADDFYEYRSGADLLEDGYGSFAPLLRDGTVWLAVPELEEGELEDVTEIRAGREWKIDSPPVPDSSPPH